MLADEVSTRMRAHGVKCQTVAVHIKDPAMKTISRQTALRHPTRLQRSSPSRRCGWYAPTGARTRRCAR
jgi:nucleotidyltransferase/DNA polymerase involved in DNA repair